MRADIRVLDDPAQEAAKLLAAASGHVAITGGSTPRRAYEQTAELRDDWAGVDFWFTDERCVPPDHEHSNFGMAHRALLSRAEGATVHRMRGELGPEDGAAAYENELGEFGPDALDLILLGVGPDAHICSLFPGDDALGERERRVVGVETPGMAPLVPRITLTLPVVNASARVVFLITGEDKAEAVQRVFAGPPDPRAPGSLVDAPDVVALLDAAAAARL
ncbi:MAG: 6-phosphogluconolactonase [Thermoleophilaceae bacterium]|jgi:6-phosphogluconolactonase|nr:6-phosphogluconolactonase [Thermoleophilaceae bacterium]MEA2406909.1 6-phosphogluconolactonase [Thermoleophilaceae bacterium]